MRLPIQSYWSSFHFRGESKILRVEEVQSAVPPASTEKEENVLASVRVVIRFYDLYLLRQYDNNKHYPITGQRTNTGPRKDLYCFHAASRISSEQIGRAPARSPVDCKSSNSVSRPHSTSPGLCYCTPRSKSEIPGIGQYSGTYCIGAAWHPIWQTGTSSSRTPNRTESNQ